MAILEVAGVEKRFGGLVAVSDFSFSLDEGEVVGLIGPNGAGKTTLFNVISGFYEPEKGHINFDGRDITSMRPDQICKLGLTRTFQVVRPFSQLSVLDNVMVGAYSRTSSDEVARSVAMETLEFLGMTSVAHQTARGLPVAARKRLEIARALATDPTVLLLDEAMAGLRPSEMDQIIEIVRKVGERGIALLIVEHVMKIIMSLAERIMVVHHGVKIADAEPSQVVHDEAVIDAYLGEAGGDA